MCYDHTMQNRPPLIRTAKSIYIGFHQYWVEGSPGNTEFRSACSNGLSLSFLHRPSAQRPRNPVVGHGLIVLTLVAVPTSLPNCLPLPALLPLLLCVASRLNSAVHYHLEFGCANAYQTYSAVFLNFHYCTFQQPPVNLSIMMSSYRRASTQMHTQQATTNCTCNASALLKW